MASQGPGKDAPAFRVIDQGAYGAVQEPGEELVADARALEALWNKLYATQTPRPPLPAIDFGKETVAAIYMGQRSTGGNAISVKSVAVAGATATVRVVEETPPRGGFVTMALTAPYVVIAIAKGPTRLAVDRAGR